MNEIGCRETAVAELELWVRRLVYAAIAICYCISFVLPTIRVFDDYLFGWQAFCFSFLMFEYSSLANLFFWIGFFYLARGEYVHAFIFGFISVLLGCRWIAEGAGALGIGYWLWFASMAMLTAGAPMMGVIKRRIQSKESTTMGAGV